MSSMPEFDWEQGTLSHVHVERLHNGFVVEVAASAEEVRTGGMGPRAPGMPVAMTAKTWKHVFTEARAAATFVSQCLMHDAGDAGDAGDAPDSSKFPDTFVRFDIDGEYVTAVFKEWGVECRRRDDRLAQHIEWLYSTIHLGQDELRPWHRVLGELRAIKEAVLVKEGVGK